MNQLKSIDITKKDIFKKEMLYRKSIEHIKHDISISFDDLGFIQCNATTGRKIIKAVYAKVNLYTVFKFYINLGIVFKDKNKKLYSMEEAEKKIIEYYKKNNIDYKI